MSRSATDGKGLPTQSWGYRADVDGLRAVAILSVIGFHALPAVVPGGFVGVDIFFVISGYLISGIILSELANRQFSFAKFYIRRVRRILPALLVVLISCLLFGWLTLLAADYAELGDEIAAGAAFVTNFQLWLGTRYFDVSADMKPLLHLWSLGVEEQFYLWWPPIVVLAWRVRLPVLVPLVVIGTASLLVSAALSSRFPTASFYLPFSRMWELLLGAGLAYAEVFRRDILDSIRQRVAVREFGAALGAVAVVLSPFYIHSTDALPGWIATVPTAGTALMVAAGPAAWLNRNVLSIRPIVWIGLISFPLYLWHWPLLVFPRYLSTDESVGQTMGLLLLSGVLAAGTYRLVERPIRFRSRPTPRQAAVLCILLAATGAAGLVVLKTEGFPGRHPQFDDRPLVALQRQLQNGTCHFDPDTGVPLTYPPECDENTGRPSIMLVGDSHAGQLYSSMSEATRQRGLDLTHYTISGCLPTQTTGVCGRLYSWIHRYAISRKPQIVVLAARWRPETVDRLAAVIHGYQATGAQVITLGPTPVWVRRPSTTLTMAARNGSLLVSRIDPAARVEAVASSGFEAMTAGLDRELARAAARAGSAYVSAYDLLCPLNRCVISANGTLAGLMYFDNDHMTEVGTRMVIARLFDNIDGARTPSTRNSK